MLASLTSKQVADWIAFASLEQIGNDVPPDKEQIQKDKNKAQRDKFEGGMRSLMNNDQ